MSEQSRPVGPVPRDVLLSSPGLEVFRRMIAGDLPTPPVCVTSNIFLAEAEEGRVVFEGRPTDAFTNPLGGIHGGWIATLLDSSMACAVHTKLTAGQAYTTVEFKLNLVKAVTPATGKLRCEGRVLQFGSRIATSEGFVRDEAGALYAHGTETCLIMAARG
ncbi:MAG TPA: PaaI family thioesterase [Stellaceae bacterium]|nr:PaaI family thioesterase [Stellaceae bacterium]